MWRYKWTNILDTISVDPLSTCHILLGWIQEIADVDCSGMEKGMRHSHSKYWTTLAGNIEILLVTATVSALGAPIPHSGIVFLPCLSSVFFLPSIVNWWSFWLGGGEVAPPFFGERIVLLLVYLVGKLHFGLLSVQGPPNLLQSRTGFVALALACLAVGKKWDTTESEGRLKPQNCATKMPKCIAH